MNNSVLPSPAPRGRLAGGRVAPKLADAVRPLVERLESRVMLCAEHGLDAGGAPAPLGEWDSHVYPDATTEPIAAASGWSLGVKRILYIRVTYADTPDTSPQTLEVAQSVMGEVAGFMTENSFGRLTLQTTFTDVVVLPQSQHHYIAVGDAVLLADARAAAKAAGLARGLDWDHTHYELDAVRFNGGPGGYTGQGYIGARGVWLKSNSAGIAAHEFGHNLGLFHANSWGPTEPATVIGPGANVDYGDVFDTMGGAAAGAHHFSAYAKNRLYWLRPANVASISDSGTYRLHAHDLGGTLAEGAFYALKVRRDFDRDYWIDFRQNRAWDAHGDRWLVNGVGIRFDPWASSGGGPQLLDTTPLSPGGMRDAPLVIGRTYSDPAAGVHITPLNRVPGASAIDVVVQLGAFPDNRAPLASFTASARSVPVGSTVTFSAQASDPDRDALAYHWDFGDRTFSTSSSATAAKVFTAAGEYRVRLVVSDMKGRASSSSLIVRVGDAAGPRISGRIAGLDGAPIEGAIVHNGLEVTDPNYRFAYSDSDGSYTLTNLAGVPHHLTAVKPGHTLLRAAFANPVAAGSSSADFVMHPRGYAVTGRVTDHQGNPMRGARVTAVDAQGRLAGAEPTDADGRYSIAGLANGSYALSAGKPGYVFKRSSLDPVLISFADASLDFAEMTYSISGEITGVPADVPVTVTDGVRTATSFRSAGRNIWTLSDVPAGRWHVRAFTDSDSFAPVGFDAMVGVSDAVTNLVFARSASRAATVSGRVTHRGAALAGAILTLWRPGSQLTRTTTTDPSGGYAFTDLTPGSYTLTVAAPELEFVTTTRPLAVSSADVGGVDFSSTAVNSGPRLVSASAMQSPAANAIVLSARGEDDLGEELLRYSWTVVSAPAGAVVVFDHNNSHSAADTLAVIDRPGAYLLRVEAMDLNGAISSTTLLATVEPAVASLVLSTAPHSLLPNQSHAFTVSAYDQFSRPMGTAENPLPPLTWSVTGGGSVSPNGLFTAGQSTGRPVVTVTAGGRSATARLRIVAPAGPGSGLLREWWTGLPGGAVTDLTRHPDYPLRPVGSELLSGPAALFETPGDAGDGYAQRLRGYFIPPVNGTYVFSIASDDASALYLSPTADEAGKAQIAFVPARTGPRQWNAFPSQRSIPIRLLAGRRYYIEAVHKEARGHDHLSVGVDLPGGISERPIPAHRLDPYGVPVASVTASDRVAGEPGTPAAATAGISAAFTISLSAPAPRDLLVPYTLSGVASAAADFEAPSGVALIRAGTSSATVRINALPDTLPEGPESLTLTLMTTASAGGYIASAAGASATAYLLDAVPPLGATVQAVTPAQRNTAVESLWITFTRPVSGFDLSDLRLTRGGATLNLLAPAQSLGTADNVHFHLSGLSALTAPAGQYALTLSPALSSVTDILGIALSQPSAISWTVSPTLRITGGIGRDTVRLALSTSNADLLEVHVNSVSGAPAMRVHLPSLKEIAVDLGPGDDTLSLDFSRGPVLREGMSFSYSGHLGTDVLRVMGTGGADTLRLLGPTSAAFNALPALSLWDVEMARLSAGPGQDTLLVEGSSAPRPFLRPSDDATPETADRLVIAAGRHDLSSLVAPGTRLVVRGDAVVNLGPAADVAALELEDRARVSLAPAGAAPSARALRTSALSLGPLACLDLYESDLLIGGVIRDEQRRDLMARLTTALAAGSAGGSWSGSGITSSAAARSGGRTTLGLLALQDGSPPIASAPGGQPPAAIVIRYTQTGDADLDGKVTLSDYFAIDRGRAMRLAGFAQGDFDFSGRIDADDYQLIDRAFLGPFGQLAAPAPAPAAPPPQTIGQEDDDPKVETPLW